MSNSHLPQRKVARPIKRLAADSRRFRSFAGLGVAILIAACSSGPSDSSDDSRFLQDVAVPGIQRWASGREETFALSGVIASRAFDMVCVLPDYTAVAAIEAELGPVDGYRGARGANVPEGSIALIGVKGKVAHVAFIGQSSVILFGEPRHCHRASSAVIRRVPGARTPLPQYTPRAILEG